MEDQEDSGGTTPLDAVKFTNGIRSEAVGTKQQAKPSQPRVLQLHQQIQRFREQQHQFQERLRLEQAQRSRIQGFQLQEKRLEGGERSGWRPRGGSWSSMPLRDPYRPGVDQDHGGPDLADQHLRNMMKLESWRKSREEDLQEFRRPFSGSEDGERSKRSNKEWFFQYLI